MSTEVPVAAENSPHVAVTVEMVYGEVNTNNFAPTPLPKTYIREQFGRTRRVNNKDHKGFIWA